MRRIGIVAVLATLLMALSASAALAAGTPIFNPAAAPQGTHVQTGTPSCSFVTGTQNVTCSSFELAGVGNTDATATLSATYTATVDCRNRGGNVVESHAGTFTATSSSGELSPVNGRLTVPSLTVTAPSEADFLAQQTCPNPNWTKEIREGTTITLVSSVYTVTFEGFTGAYITIIDP
jgi:long-subunit fatty acid transport protein